MGRSVHISVGKHHTSPLKVRSRKTKQHVQIDGQDDEREALLAKRAAIRERARQRRRAAENYEAEQEAQQGSDYQPSDDEIVLPGPSFSGPSSAPAPAPFTATPTTPTRSTDENPAKVTKEKNSTSNSALDALKNWQALLPTLQDPYLNYLSQSIGKIFVRHRALTSFCLQDGCAKQTLKILCLHDDLLVLNGLFPATPSMPQIAVSIALLDLYRALFERSCDAITAMAAALNTMYGRKGFRLLNSSGELTKDPFRRSFGYAVQWYDALLVRTAALVEDAIHESTAKDSASESLVDPAPDTPEATPLHQLQPGECHRILRQLCPACFGAKEFGMTFNKGGDVHVALDGNFHHKHMATATEEMPFHANRHFVPKSFVDVVRLRTAKARGRAPKDHRPVVPDIAIDGCKESHKAAKASEAQDDTNGKPKPSKFDDKGLMALVCRHDIPLLFANIDTPGEGQEYGLALLEYFFCLLPLIATVLVLYDIGCVLDRSLNKYDLLPGWITSRLLFATSAMHAYGHQWSCQLVYNPRLRRGLGLTDGEGVERLWSRLRRLIGLERHSSRARRLWLIDRQADAIASELRSGLGDWIATRLKKGVVGQGGKAQQLLDACGIQIAVLRTEWCDQKLSQLSVRAHAPAQLKKEVSKVLALNAEIDAIDTLIQNVSKAIKGAHGTRDSMVLIKALKKTQDTFKEQAESLYASLNLAKDFPNLVGLPTEFVHFLILTKDLKINTRYKAICSFFEWDRLDQSVSGREQTIGTKEHQTTRQAIAQRKPALMNSIRLYNSYCDKLKTLSPSNCPVPIPQPLPTDLQNLRDSIDLLQDVCIDPSAGPIPAWLADEKTRKGIQAMLKLDRCHEERQRLGRESMNLCHWFGRELSAVELARRLPKFQTFRHLLEKRHQDLLLLKLSWQHSLASEIQFDCAVRTAIEVADKLAGTPSAHLKWITVQGIDEVQHRSRQTSLRATCVDSVASDILALEVSQVDSDAESETETQATSDLVQHTDLTAHRRAGPIDFEPREIKILLRSQARLTSGCMNGLAAIMKQLIHTSAAADSALFSTFVPPLSAHCDDNTLWNNVKATSYWSKSYWIFPLHRIRQEHWVLILAVPQHRSFHVFDSFAGNANSWKSDLAQMRATIHRLGLLAGQHGFPLALDPADTWAASPLSTLAVQTNGYDCGLWVLSVIAAILRESHTSGLTEVDMPQFRNLCYQLTQLLPLHQPL
ncbi:hypothetical protein C8J56DRAFT_795492 [Mycena floridula]|nr:hypothetical protein C8J56DRAFT_795492 [Mycena floridula]